MHGSGVAAMMPRPEGNRKHNEASTGRTMTTHRLEVWEPQLQLRSTVACGNGPRTVNNSSLFAAVKTLPARRIELSRRGHRYWPTPSTALQEDAYFSQRGDADRSDADGRTSASPSGRRVREGVPVAEQPRGAAGVRGLGLPGPGCRHTSRPDQPGAHGSPKGTSRTGQYASGKPPLALRPKPFTVLKPPRRRRPGQPMDILREAAARQSTHAGDESILSSMTTGDGP